MTDHAMIEVRIVDVERMHARIAELEGKVAKLRDEVNYALRVVTGPQDRARIRALLSATGERES